MDRRKGGRPKLEITRDVLIGARFTAAESDVIEAAARRLQLVKSDWIRQTLLGAAAQTSTPDAPAGIAPSSSELVHPEFLD